MPIRVLIADDHPVVRVGLRALIAIEPDLALVGEASDGVEAVAQHATLAPDVTLMDLRMPAGHPTRRRRSAGRVRAARRPDRAREVEVLRFVAKLAAADRTEAVTVALQRGVMHLDD